VKANKNVKSKSATDPKSANKEFEINFADTDLSEAGQLAFKLREHLSGREGVKKVRLKKEDSSNLDFGGTLILVLAAPAVVIAAKGIPPALKKLAEGMAAFLKKKRSSIDINDKETGKRLVRVRGEDAAAAAKIIRALNTANGVRNAKNK
jgi:hypothetical protein